jgi:hypothetical protein
MLIPSRHEHLGHFPKALEQPSKILIKNGQISQDALIKQGIGTLGVLMSTLTVPRAVCAPLVAGLLQGFVAPFLLAGQESAAKPTRDQGFRR